MSKRNHGSRLKEQMREECFFCGSQIKLKLVDINGQYKKPVCKDCEDLSNFGENDDCY